MPEGLRRIQQQRLLSFGVRHRYAMVLHTDQAHPHVHLVVKAEDEYGRRLHIDKPMLRDWREGFARTMREQGIAANATPRVIRGRNKGKVRDGVFRAQVEHNPRKDNDDSDRAGEERPLQRASPSQTRRNTKGRRHELDEDR